MKMFFFYVFFSSAFIVSAQDSTSFTKEFVRSFQKEFNAASGIENDSCIDRIILFRLFINNESKVSIFEFSDNAPDQYREDLARIKHNLNVLDIEEYFKQKKQININLIFPLHIINEVILASSKPVLSLNNFNRFQKSILIGNCFIADPISFIIYPTQH